MRIDEALQQLDLISAVADRSRTFDGLRAAPTAASGVIALLAAAMQTQLVSSSPTPLQSYLLLWIGVAAVSLSIVIADMTFRYYRDPTARARRMTLEVLSRLAPAMVVGAALTLIVFVTSPEVAWMLPGLWSLLLGLGIFAASSLLPRSLSQVAIWYIGCGLAVLMMSHGDGALSPLAMAIPFGGGQCFAAWLMHQQTRKQEVHV
ncbi:hypothetical protein [Novipirellula caenicola]|uniref:Uncharacterized protein n=1 Tax=Novipirellula caenicola TaxID=1536901 RepID=A0ABP9VP33_9BACT